MKDHKPDPTTSAILASGHRTSEFDPVPPQASEAPVSNEAPIVKNPALNTILKANEPHDAE
jgi:hypothetical protein